MIQRIQTLFMIVAACLMLVATFAPLSTITSSSQLLTFYATHIEDIKGQISYTPVLVLQGFLMLSSALLSFINVMLFAKRKLQMLLSIVNVAIIVVVCNVLVFTTLGHVTSPDHSVMFAVSSVMPIIAFILHILAYRAIKKDEMLVRSLNRIR